MTESTNVQPVAADGAAPAAAATQWNWWSMGKTMVMRMAFTYFVFNMFRQPAKKPTTDSQGPTSQLSPSTNLYPRGQLFDMYAYLSIGQSSVFAADSDSPAVPNQLIWHQPNLVYGDWTAGPNKDGQFVKTLDIDCLNKFPEVLNNGSLYLHVYLVKTGLSPDPKRSPADKKEQFSTVYMSKMLTRHKRRRLSRTVNLITGQTDKHPDLIADTKTPSTVSHLPPVTHWHPNFTINLVDDQTPWTQGAVPQPLDQLIHFHPLSNEYYPILFMNDYWNLNEDYQPVNSSTPSLSLTLTFSPLSLFKWQLYAAQSLKSQNWLTSLMSETSMGSEPDADDNEQDTLKKTLLGTNPYLLGITAVVSIVHCVFEMLAFKNDIQFWNSRQSLEGLSVRSIIFNVFQSFVVFLYVLDNHTNIMITISVLVGLGIEIWKIKKVLKITFDHETLWFGVIPRIQIEYQSSYVESDTKKYDQMAFGYLSWALYPLLLAYAVYSLIYQEHRGWYSWMLSMLYGFFLTFGFIMMTPQLFINYKLKSIAHLPWRMLTYKALNTFIDDLFAFVIYMPTLYRIGCLRDDIIFFIYLYQRYIYPTDPHRVNEFGVSKEMLDKRNQPATVADEAGDEVAVANDDDSSAAGAVDAIADKSESSEPESVTWEVVNGGDRGGTDGQEVRRRDSKSSLTEEQCD